MWRCSLCVFMYRDEQFHTFTDFSCNKAPVDRCLAAGSSGRRQEHSIPLTAFGALLPSVFIMAGFYLHVTLYCYTCTRVLGADIV